MRFAALGSGSKGNAWLVESGTTRLLLDCGFSLAETTRRLARLGCTPEQLDGVVLTHEHGDHVAGAGPLARRHRVPVWMTHGTFRALRDADFPEPRLFDADVPFAVGDLEVTPFAVPHDANEPCQAVVGDGRHRLGLLTDLGSVTAHVERSLDGCDALVLEANHDAEMLAGGPYPASLKARIAGRHGHLSNAAAAALLGRIDCGRLQHLVAAHLSDSNNTPALARAAFATALGCAADEVPVAAQGGGLGWRELG